MTADAHAFLLARLEDDEARARTPMGDATYWQQVHPARVLAQCAALRAVVMLHETAPAREVYSGDGWWVHGHCPTCTQDGEYAVTSQEPTDDACTTLRAIATIYADHPDFDARWLA